MAYEQFMVRHLRSGESVDVYLADLRKLASLFGGISEQSLTCAFVARLRETNIASLFENGRDECKPTTG